MRLFPHLSGRTAQRRAAGQVKDPRQPWVAPAEISGYPGLRLFPQARNGAKFQFRGSDGQAGDG
jgi:hypothetical protein